MPELQPDQLSRQRAASKNVFASRFFLNFTAGTRPDLSGPISDAQICGNIVLRYYADAFMRRRDKNDTNPLPCYRSSSAREPKPRPARARNAIPSQADTPTPELSWAALAITAAAPTRHLLADAISDAKTERTTG